MYDFFFKMIQKIMWLILFYWIFAAYLFAFELSMLLGIACILLAIVVWKHKIHIAIGLQKLKGHNKVLICLAILFQIGVILSANLLVRRDAGVVINGAFRLIADSSISNYLSRNPNNVVLFLYERILYNLFGFRAIWILQGLGLLYINSTAYIIYRTAKTYFCTISADLALKLYLLLLGFSPYVIQTYTDIIALPLLALQLMWVFACLQSRDIQFGSIIWLGFVTAVAICFRPTAIISIIAFYMLLFLSKSWKKLLTYLTIFLIVFGMTYGSLQWGISRQQEVVIQKDERLAKSWLTFINLGLTFSGTDQEDMKQGLLQYIPESERDQYNNGIFANEFEIKEIKRRLSEYTPHRFAYHILYKLFQTLYDGSLNWLYTEPEKEKSAFVSPLYPYTSSNGFAEWMRQTVIQKDGQYYQYYQMVKQCIWIVLVAGLFKAVWKYQTDTRVHFLSLSIFGGLLFLMIFEGGKTRYLLQFFPQIILLASYGLHLGFTKENK